MARLVAMLEVRGLIEVYLDERGPATYQLTPVDVRVGKMLAMVEVEDADKVLEAPLRHGH